MNTTTSGTNISVIQVEIPTYPPSWYDRLMSWVDRLPIPSWLFFTAFGGMLILIEWVLWVLETPGQAISLKVPIFVFVFQLVYLTIVINILDNQAVRLLERIRPYLRLGDDHFSTLKDRFTSMPQKPLRSMTVGVVLFLVIFFSWFSTLELDQVTAAAVTLLIFQPTPAGYFAMLVFGMVALNNMIFIYHTVHQLKAINFSYTHFSRINLFNQSDLYAFSSLAASTAIGAILSAPIWLLMDSGPANLVINSVITLIAIITFTWPLLGAHRILKEQKDQMLRESFLKKEQLIQELFARLDRKDLNGMEELEKAFSSMEKGHAMLEHISTWPWQTRTLRQIAGAILLPITIWVIQYLLSQMLSG